MILKKKVKQPGLPSSDSQNRALAWLNKIETILPTPKRLKAFDGFFGFLRFTLICVAFFTTLVLIAALCFLFDHFAGPTLKKYGQVATEMGREWLTIGLGMAGVVLGWIWRVLTSYLLWLIIATLCLWEITMHLRSVIRDLHEIKELLLEQRKEP